LGEVLVGVDGSKFSIAIVDYACDLAERMKDMITLIHVSSDRDIINDYIEYGGSNPHANAQIAIAVAESITTRLIERIEARGIKHEILFKSGNSAQKIVSAAGQRNSDIIVIGVKGLHGVQRIRSLGSVSRRILENSPCPVIIVPLG
jgi:nucleotide-binding universal stress UspA family protein